MTHAKRAVFCVGAYRPDLFGIGRFVPHFVDSLAAAGWTADVIAPYPHYPSWELDRSVPKIGFECEGAVRVTRYAPYVPRQHTALTRAVHEFSLAQDVLRRLPGLVKQADLVVAATPPLMGSLIAMRMAKRQRIPSVLLVYDLVADLASDVFPLGGGVATIGARRLEADLMNEADRVITLSDEMAHRVTRVSGRKSSVDVIPIWADDELFEIDGEAPRECRATLGIPPDRFLLGFAGTFARKQRLPQIVDALGGMNGDFTTVFVGAGLERTGMETAARRNAGDVRILGPLCGRALYGFLGASDFSIVPALNRHGGTGFPSKVANILAAGCPILALTHDKETQLAKLLRDERLGLVCPSLDAEKIREAVRVARALPGVEDRRRRCRDHAAAHLRKADAMERFLEHVDELVPMRSGLNASPA